VLNDFHLMTEFFMNKYSRDLHIIVNEWQIGRAAE